MDETSENPWTAERLAKVGLTLIDPNALTVECTACGKIWKPLTQSGGGVNPRWWRCTNGCNKGKRYPKR